jgi:hypothetical protein
MKILTPTLLPFHQRFLFIIAQLGIRRPQKQLFQSHFLLKPSKGITKLFGNTNLEPKQSIALQLRF